MSSLSYALVEPLDWFQLRHLLWNAIRAVPKYSPDRWESVARLINRDCSQSQPIDAHACRAVVHRLAAELPEASALEHEPEVGTRVWNHLLYAIAQQKFFRPHFMNLGYASDESQQPLDLEEQDEANRLFIQLYERTVNGVSLQGREVVEIGCGGGGGAHYLCRRHRPAAYTGIDLVAENVATCGQLPPLEMLRFIQGAAESIALPDESVDVIINIESSFTYDFDDFLREVVRILRPGGLFMITDHRPHNDEWGVNRSIAAFRQRLRDSGLRVHRDDDITPGVVAASTIMGEAKQSLVSEFIPVAQDQRHFNEILHCPGSQNYERLRSGAWEYRTLLLQKPSR